MNMRPDPGAGYRLLEHGEERQPGDETLRHGGKEWLPVTELGIHAAHCDPCINNGDPHWPTRRRVPQNWAHEMCRVCSEPGNWLPDLGIALCSNPKCWEAFRQEYNGESTQQASCATEEARTDMSNTNDTPADEGCARVTGSAFQAQLQAKIVELKARIEQLESHLEKTADGKLVCETTDFYCPHCGNKVRAEYDLAYCDECPNEDGGDWPYTPPLPMFYSVCLATPPNNQAQQREKTL